MQAAVDAGHGAYEHAAVALAPAVVASVGAVPADAGVVPAVMDGNASLEPVQRSWHQKPPRSQKPTGEPACRLFCKI